MNTNIIWRILNFYKNNGIKKTINKIQEKLLSHSSSSLNMTQTYEQIQKEKKDIYYQWREKYKTSVIELIEQKKAKFAMMPLISIVIPTYNTREIYLKELLNSIKAQTYTKWEICIADGASSDESTLQLLKKISKENNCIRVKFLRQNLGISGNTNEAIKITHGSYIAFSDHDDIWEPDALYEIVKAININNADIVYTDEDKVDENSSIFYEPHIKPDYSPEQLSCCNYFCHLVVVSRKILDKTGFLDSRFDGSQDHELILRICDNTDRITHVPKILYHWRQFAASMSKQNLERCQEKGRKAVQEHLFRKGIKGKVIQDHGYRISYSLKAIPLVSIIILVSSDFDRKMRQIRQILEQTSYKQIEFILINATETDYKGARENSISIISAKNNAGEYKQRNIATEKAAGEYFIFMNENIVPLTNRWVQELLMYAQHEDAGAVSSKIFYSDNNRIFMTNYILHRQGLPDRQFNGHRKGIIGHSGLERIVRNVSAVSDYLLMVKKSDFKYINGFDDEYTKSCGDIDLCLQLLDNNKRNVYTPYAPMILRSDPLGDFYENDVERLQRKMGKKLHDKYCRRNYEDEIRGELRSD